MGTKRRRASQSEINMRQRIVELQWMKGVPESEIAKQLRVSDQTIYRDILEIKEVLKKETRRELLKPVKLAFLEYRELKRLLWRMLEQEPVQNSDDRFAKLAIIDRLSKIMKEENRLACHYYKLGDGILIPNREEEQLPSMEEWRRRQEEILETGRRIGREQEERELRSKLLLQNASRTGHLQNRHVQNGVQH